MLPPLIVDAMLRLCLRSSRPVRGGIWLGVLVAAQIFIGEEMLFEACLTAVLLVAVLAASRPGRSPAPCGLPRSGSRPASA